MSDGQTIVLVTHEHDIAEHARRQVHLKDGKVERDFDDGEAGVMCKACHRAAKGRAVLAPRSLGMTVVAARARRACKKEAPPVAYQAVPVERRDIVVSAQASGAVQPDTTVEVKSKASGEILQLNAETGQIVKRGAPLVKVDPRNARNALAQAQADLDVAKAKLTNSTSQKRRADELFKSQSITEQEHEQRAARLCRRARPGGRAPGGGGQRAHPARRHRCSRPHHRHHHREGRRAGPGDLVGHHRT